MDNIGFEPITQARKTCDSCVLPIKLITPVYLIFKSLNCFYFILQQIHYNIYLI